MRHIALMITMLVACLALAASSPIDWQRRLVNHPHQVLESRGRQRRAEHYAKGGIAGTKTQSLPVPVLRKGEYVCGNKVCKLRAGERPPCEHCQYPV